MGLRKSGLRNGDAYVAGKVGVPGPERDSHSSTGSFIPAYRPPHPASELHSISHQPHSVRSIDRKPTVPQGVIDWPSAPCQSMPHDSKMGGMPQAVCDSSPRQGSGNRAAPKGVKVVGKGWSPRHSSAAVLLPKGQLPAQLPATSASDANLAAPATGAKTSRIAGQSNNDHAAKSGRQSSLNSMSVLSRTSQICPQDMKDMQREPGLPKGGAHEGDGAEVGESDGQDPQNRMKGGRGAAGRSSYAARWMSSLDVAMRSLNAAAEHASQALETRLRPTHKPVRAAPHRQPVPNPSSMASSKIVATQSRSDADTSTRSNAHASMQDVPVAILHGASARTEVIQHRQSSSGTALAMDRSAARHSVQHSNEQDTQPGNITEAVPHHHHHQQQEPSQKSLYQASQRMNPSAGEMLGSKHTALDMQPIPSESPLLEEMHQDYRGTMSQSPSVQDHTHHHPGLYVVLT